MSHELSRNEITGQYEMAFVGETPWHGLGQSVQEGATIEQWQQAAGLNWQAKESPVQYAFETKIDENTSRVIMRTNGEKKVIYRSDTGAALGTVGTGYNSVQPSDVLEFFRDLAEAGDWHIHTAGALKGGRKIWALARNHTEGQAAKGDTVKGNLLLATSLDGTMKTVAAMTAVRVVCANTLRLALADNTDKIEVSHRSEFDPKEVKRALGVARESFAGFMTKAQQMAQTQISRDETMHVLRTLFGSPIMEKTEAGIEVPAGTMSPFIRGILSAKPADVQAPKIKREAKGVDRALALFGGEGMGALHPASLNTRWGLFNAVTQIVDHEMGRTDDTRLDNAWFGAGHKLKSQALDLLTA